MNFSNFYSFSGSDVLTLVFRYKFLLTTNRSAMDSIGRRNPYGLMCMPVRCLGTVLENLKVNVQKLKKWARRVTSPDRNFSKMDTFSIFQYILICMHQTLIIQSALDSTCPPSDHIVLWDMFLMSSGVIRSHPKSNYIFVWKIRLGSQFSQNLEKWRIRLRKPWNWLLSIVWQPTRYQKCSSNLYLPNPL